MKLFILFLCSTLFFIRPTFSSSSQSLAKEIRKAYHFVQRDHVRKIKKNYKISSLAQLNYFNQASLALGKLNKKKIKILSQGKNKALFKYKKHSIHIQRDGGTTVFFNGVPWDYSKGQPSKRIMKKLEETLKKKRVSFLESFLMQPLRAEYSVRDARLGDVGAFIMGLVGLMSGKNSERTKEKARFRKCNQSIHPLFSKAIKSHCNVLGELTSVAEAEVSYHQKISQIVIPPGECAEQGLAMKNYFLLPRMTSFFNTQTKVSTTSGIKPKCLAVLEYIDSIFPAITKGEIKEGYKSRH